jgi:hypothetical protein
MAPAGQEPAPPGRWRAPVRWLLTVTAITAVLVGLCWGYLLQSRTQGADADSAGMVLQGWDMVEHGNLLLRGWVMADVSFYTFEIPVDGLVAAVHGLQVDVIHVAAAIEYTLLVLFAALVAAGAARDRRRGSREAWARGLIAAGIMVAPSPWNGTGVLLGGPDHTAVGVPVLITLLIVDRVVPRRWLPAAATLLLTFVLLVWAQLDDLVATLSCAVPLAVVCGASVAAFLIAAGIRRLGGRVRGRRAQSADPAQAARPGGQSLGYDAALAVLAAASFGVTELLIRGIWHVGGFYLRAIPAGSQVSALRTVPAQARALVENLMILFGANFWGRQQPQVAFAYLHLVCVAVALLGLLITIARWRRADRVTRALAVGVIVMLVAGAMSPLMIPIGGTHEVAVVLPLGAAIGGRVVGPWLTGFSAFSVPPAFSVPADLSAPSTLSAQPVPSVPSVPSSQLARVGRVTRTAAACGLAAVGVGLLCAFGYAASLPAEQPRDAALADWLAAHDLTSGLSGYWNANITTLVTGGDVHLAPVISDGKYGYLWVAKEEWFNPAVSAANFIVTTTTLEGGSDVDLHEALAWYGKPAQIYQFQQYSILVYHRNLLNSVIQPVPSQLYAPPGAGRKSKTTGAVRPTSGKR